jgi:hypothetical protein
LKDLTALTPPLLMCAVVIGAIVAFVRHEMGRSRTDRGATADDFPASARKPAGEFDGNAASGADASAPASRDS